MNSKDSIDLKLLSAFLDRYRQVLLTENFTVNNFLHVTAIEVLLDGLHPDKPNSCKKRR